MQQTWLRRTSISEKVTALKKYLLLKKLFFWKSGFLEATPTSGKYIFWIITNPEEVGSLKHNSSCAKKYLSARRSWSEKELVSKKSY